MALLLLTLSVICQAKLSTKHFVIELEWNADFSNQNFLIKLDRRTLSGNPSDIADTNGYTEPDSQTDKKRHEPDSYWIKPTLIDSISWQWLYATNLLVAYELILTNKNTSQCPTPYSWLLLEAVVTVGWLLKSYWNPDSSLFNPIEGQETSQNPPFAITTMMPGTEQDQPQYQPSQSPGQNTSQATTHITGYYTSLLHSDTGGGNEDPGQSLHTLGLNCFVYPCDDVCRFRQSPNPSDSVNGVASGSISEAADTTPPVGQATCNVILMIDDGQLRQCGKVFKNKKVLLSHKSKYHTGQKTCDLTSVGEDGQLEPCGMVCKNARALSNHKNRYHTGQKTCYATVFGEDGQIYPCGKVCKNAQALSNHKTHYHTRQKTCGVRVFGEVGQLRPCGMVCQNAQVLSNHKRYAHTRQQICDATVTGEDGRQRLCGKIYKHTLALSYHKTTYHTGQKTCDVTLVSEDGPSRPCGIVCKNAKALSNHKRIHRKRKPVDANQDNDLTP
ncbi:hypothetical protein [Endozoicomonas sp. 8E]|uniref:hypothetical protein n=1 Tax=Endozoicomonas sp. 8E TaxID=3035692 RepID=UPI002938EC32|nr:hypothetical protein [Endozoicomonas sp. 8E]WOG27936.1 hypothetical protein P6910_25905 [Endozoicomonas sp. 8E]